MAAVLVPDRVASAQTAPVPPPVTGRNWSPVVPIPGYQPDTLPPILVVDQNRTVHAFVTLPLSDDPADPASLERGIFYRHWTLEGGWTEPNDIMLTPLKLQARVKSVFLDDAGMFHMVFYGGDEQDANIYYTWAPAVNAASAQAWSSPFAVGPKPIAPEVASITGDGGDHLMVVYSGNLGEGSSLYAVYSDDAGATWSAPVLIFSTYLLDNKVFDFSLHRGESGRVYVVWNVTDKFGQNVAGYYAKMDSIPDKRWTVPEEIDTGVGLGIAIPAITEYNGDVMMIYNNGVEGEVSPVMWFRMSTDSGVRFSEPLRAFPTHIGRNGVISFVEDSNGTLHTFFGQRIGGGHEDGYDLHGMWHAIWQGDSWSALQPVVSGAFSQAFDPYDAHAVALQGNVLFVTWRTDPGREVSSTWYSYRLLDAPELLVQPLPTPVVALALGRLAIKGGRDAGASNDIVGAEELSMRALLPEPTPTPQALSEFSLEPNSAADAGPGVPLVGALVPTVLFVVAALLLDNMRRHRATGEK